MFCFVRDELLWYPGQGEFRVVVLEGIGYVIQSGVQGEAVEYELEPAGFSVYSVNDHMVAEHLLECQKVWFIVHPSSGQEGVEDQVVAFCEVGAGEKDV